MNACDFISTLYDGVSSSNSTISIENGQHNKQFFDANVSSVDHSNKTVRLAAHLDYGGDDAWLYNVNDIEHFFQMNAVKRDYNVVFENHDSKCFNNIKFIKTNVFELC